MEQSEPTLSVIIPAFNEEKYLPRYLPSVLDSLRRWEHHSGLRGEVIVVDNRSTDKTAHLARELGSHVIYEPVAGIGRARNTGAAIARGAYLLFIDADVLFPAEGISKIVRVLDTVQCVGGAIPPRYEPTKIGIRLLVAAWALYRRFNGGAQGVTQFCTRAAFTEINGYRPDLFMSEDVEFFARLTRHGKRIGAPVRHLTGLWVRPSHRRFEQWPSWRMILWANPLTAHLFLSSRRFWRNWYEHTVR
ncbi:hypothetical protein Sru01_34170 [Sphaerisporangium rufum]|uniref:4,4'-diaponeurosporenoate glycosyltransferase n=1 Tax=Sphaerisporangium rufum TaxID=1381558 RepID=A0A919V5L9_9ACTN|nr:glycosyltransferase [Sphaerisporangium rufum]GII78435.1 hypothetical protein Sru01_34170 [Sphaerisporangium rufum]